MRMKSLKKLLWAVNALLVVAMAAFVLDGFVLSEQKGPTPDVLGIGQRPAGKTTIQVNDLGPFHNYRHLHELPIAGFPPEKPVETEAPVEAREVVALATRYDLLWVKREFPNVIESFIHYSPKGQPADLRHLAVGANLEGWKLVDVLVEGSLGKAVFESAATGERVELVQVAPPAGSGAIGAANGGGVLTPPPGGVIQMGGSPAKIPTYEEGPAREAVRVANAWHVPPEEVRWLETHGEKLADSVVLEPVKDPKTGRPMGLLVKSVEKAPVLKRHGIQSDDILVSVNGVPMSSKQEGLKWFRNEGKGQSRYTVVIERKGRLITETFQMPPEK